MSVSKRREKAIARRQWVIDLRAKWDAQRDEAGGAGLALLNFMFMGLNLAVGAFNIATGNYYLLPINFGFALLSLCVGLWAMTQ